MTALNSANGSVIGAPVLPTFTAASGVWHPSDIALRLTNGPTVANDGNWPLQQTDASFSSVTLLCHFDVSGAPSGILETTPNVGSVGGTLSLNGTAQLATGQVKFSARSLHLNNTGTVTGGASIPSNTGFQFGTGDFTIECFIYFNTLVATNFFDLRSAANSVAPLIYSNGADGTIRYFVSNADRITSAGGTVTTGTWYHIACARTGTSTKLFVAGTQVGSTFTDSNNYTAGVVTLGNGSFGSSPMNGYMAEARITKGVCRYTTTFTPPTSRFPDY